MFGGANSLTQWYCPPAVGHLYQTSVWSSLEEKSTHVHTRHLGERGVNQHHTQPNDDEAPEEKRRTSISEDERKYTGSIVSITQDRLTTGTPHGKITSQLQITVDPKPNMVMNLKLRCSMRQPCTVRHTDVYKPLGPAFCPESSCLAGRPSCPDI